MATASEATLIAKYFGGLASAARAAASTQSHTQEDVIHRLFSGISKRLQPASQQACPVIGVQQAVQKLADPGYVFVDVRETSEIAGALGVPGAISAPFSSGKLDDLLKVAPSHRPAKLADTSKTVVLYCNNGSRAAAASRRLQSSGFSNVAALSGFNSWVAAKAPVAPISLHTPVVQSALAA